MGKIGNSAITKECFRFPSESVVTNLRERWSIEFESLGKLWGIDWGIDKLFVYNLMILKLYWLLR